MPTSSSVPTITYSKAASCDPELIRFDQLGERIDYTFPPTGKTTPDRLKPESIQDTTSTQMEFERVKREPVIGQLRDQLSDRMGYRLVRLPDPGSAKLIVHLYNGSGTDVRVTFLSVRGQVLAKPQILTAVADKIELGTDERPGGDVYIRIDYQSSAELRQRTDGEPGRPFIGVVAYLDEEPGSKGSLSIRTYDRCHVGEPERQLTVELPFNCGGTATQRLVFSSCDPEFDMRAWVTKSGLKPTEEYYGRLGRVVAMGVREGLNLNTTGGAARTVESEVNGGDGTVSPDYLINLYKQLEDPSASDGSLKVREEAPNGLPDGQQGDFCPPAFDHNQPPIVVAIIDSGVDDSAHNRDRWEATRYRQRVETEFIRPWKLGFDFMDKDFAPEDRAAHGTSVAATILRQYQSTRPLNFLHLKTFGDKGISTYFGALVSIYEAVAAGANIINMSWGVYGEVPPPGLECAIKTAVEHNVKLVTSAGNDCRNLDETPQWPAAFAGSPKYQNHIISVASFGPDDPNLQPAPDPLALSSYSNFGEQTVSLAAFMTAGVPKAGSAEMIYPLGTSISAPIVTGLLANWLADNPGGTVGEFCEKFCERTCHLEHKTISARYIPVERSSVLLV